MLVKTEGEIPPKKDLKNKLITEELKTFEQPETDKITIPRHEYDVLIRDMERLRLIEAYVFSNEYYSVDTMRALVGYTEEE